MGLPAGTLLSLQRHHPLLWSLKEVHRALVLPKGPVFFGLYNTHSKAQADPRTWVHAIHLGDSPWYRGKEGKPALYLRTCAMCRDLLRQSGVPPGFIHGGSDCQGTHVLAGSRLMLADSKPGGLTPSCLRASAMLSL